MAESQLFQFLLSANGPDAPAGSLVQMTITDSSGKVVDSLSAPAGDTVSNNAVFLAPGAYTLSFTVVAPSGSPVPTLSYNLTGESISDPIGATVTDPTLTPIYTSPTLPGPYLYPDGTMTVSPYLIIPM